MQSPTPSEKLQLGCHVRLKNSKSAAKFKAQACLHVSVFLQCTAAFILAACEQTKWKNDIKTGLLHDRMSPDLR